LDRRRDHSLAPSPSELSGRLASPHSPLGNETIRYGPVDAEEVEWHVRVDEQPLPLAVHLFRVGVGYRSPAAAPGGTIRSILSRSSAVSERSSAPSASVSRPGRRAPTRGTMSLPRESTSWAVVPMPSPRVVGRNFTSIPRDCREYLIWTSKVGERHQLAGLSPTAFERLI